MILRNIIANKKVQIQKEKQLNPLKDIITACENIKTRNFKEALNKSTISIIAEIKKASPSKGIITQNFDPVNIAKRYNSLDIEAISVLTEEKFFLGNYKYISMVKEVTLKPILRKDFIIDRYQIYQSKAIGADAVLLIVSILGERLKKFYNLASTLGLYSLVEVHNKQELDIAITSGCDIIGINNRNLQTFDVDLKTTENLIKHIPKNITIVSESGIKTPKEIRYLKALGVNAVLIGETFMRNIDNTKQIQEFIVQSKM